MVLVRVCLKPINTYNGVNKSVSETLNTYNGVSKSVSEPYKYL